MSYFSPELKPRSAVCAMCVESDDALSVCYCPDAAMLLCVSITQMLLCVSIIQMLLVDAESLVWARPLPGIEGIVMHRPGRDKTAHGHARANSHDQGWVAVARPAAEDDL